MAEVVVGKPLCGGRVKAGHLREKRVAIVGLDIDAVKEGRRLGSK